MRISNAEEKMLRDYEKLIYKLANKQYLRYNKKYALEDVLQEAKISAVRAFRNYDKSKNTKLITHLYNYINFYLSHYFRSDTGLIKIPSRVRIRLNVPRPTSDDPNLVEKWSAIHPANEENYKVVVARIRQQKF